MPALIPEPVNNPSVALKPGIADISDDVCTWAFHAGCPVRNVWGTTTFPDHSDGQCLDFMITSKANGDRLAQYLIDNADRLGLQWLIWYRRIYRYQDTDRGHGWAAYTGTSNPHTDHVHAQFRPGFKPGVALKPAAISTQKGLLGMPSFESKVCSKDQIWKPGDDLLIRLEDNGDCSFGFGGGSYLVVFRLALDGLQPGDDFRVTPYYVDTDSKGHYVGARHEYPVVGIPGTYGSTWGQVVFSRDVPEPAKGLTRRLRIHGGYSGAKPVTLTSIQSDIRKG